MVPLSRRRVLLAVGVVLVTVPLWAPALDVTGHDHEYRTADVVVDDNRVSVPGRHVRLTGLDGVDCFAEREPSRRCGFEARLLAGDTVRADYPNLRHVSGDPSLAAPERYVAFSGDGRVFERTTAWNESAGTYVLGLDRVSAARVLDEAARPLAVQPDPVRRAVATGSVRADEPLDDSRLVETGDGYVLVYGAGPRTLLSAAPGAERVFEALAVLGGLLAFARAESPGE
jgi:hypothetical protein